MIKTTLVGIAISAVLIHNANAFNVDISAKPDGNNPPKILGRTNLPNGTQLMVSVNRSENGYGADAKTLVINGEFEAGPFKLQDGKLTSGTYSISVIMTDPALQLQHVKDVIGANGKKLTGKLVKTYATGNRGARYKTNFSIEGKIDKVNDLRIKNSYDTDAKYNFCTSGCYLSSGESPIKYNHCIRTCMK